MPDRQPARLAFTLLVLACLASAPLRADWQGDIEGGTEIGDGSAATRLRGTLAENTRAFTQTFVAEWVRAGDRGNAYHLAYLPRYWFAQRFYLLGEARLRLDEPLGIEREVRALAGLGAELLADADTALGLELGVGSVATRFEDEFGGGLEDDESLYGLLRGYARRTFAERIRLDANAALERSDRVTDLAAEVGVALSLATGSVRYAVRTQRVDIDDGPSRTVTRGYLSFGYRF